MKDNRKWFKFGDAQSAYWDHDANKGARSNSRGRREDTAQAPLSLIVITDGRVKCHLECTTAKGKPYTRSWDFDGDVCSVVGLSTVVLPLRLAAASGVLSC